MADWAVALSDAYKPDEVPEGWHTVGEMADTLGLADTTLHRRLRKLISDGRAERKVFKIKLERCHRDVTHYRLL
jgi:DNA-binding HxlR family transcriptional regulator